MKRVADYCAALTSGVYRVRALVGGLIVEAVESSDFTDVFTCQSSACTVHSD